jgi:uncharacterized protein YdeI (BOF family)
MKKLTLFMAALMLAAIVGSAAQNAPQQAPPSQDPPSAQQQPAAPDEGAQKQTQTFMGQITQSNGQYILRDSASNVSYQLDDQNEAKKFDGQKVKVTGTLDSASNTIHVEKIEAATS